MHEYYVWLLHLPKLLILWEQIIPSTFARTCHISNHKFITNNQTYELLGRKDFKPSNASGNYLPMVLDKKRNRLIIGAKNYIFYVDDTTLVEERVQYWKSEEKIITRCLKQNLKSTKWNWNDSCSNYVHFLAIHKDKLFVCGTNSLQPKYKLILLDALSTIKEKTDYDVCSPRLDLTMVGDITEMGELISGSYTDVYQKRPLISGVLINGGGRRKMTDKKEKMHLDQPEFISSAYVNDSVYIFLMEKASEDNGRNTATVVRLCQGDNGGSRLVGLKGWTTYRKSRLVCVVTKGKEKYHFRNLVAVVYDDIQDVFYASYTMFKYLNMHSAVCTFKRQNVDYTFSGNFLDTKSPNNIHPVPNGNFLFGCNVNPANLTKTGPPVGGKQPTNFLTRKALTKAMGYVLMERKVYNSPKIFEFIQTGVSFTQLALDSSKQFRVLNIGTKDGRILMVYKNKKSKPCIIKEIVTNVGAVQRLLINEKKRILYVGSDAKVISLDLDNCHIHTNEVSCIQDHNPLCGWSVSKRRCVATWNDSNVVQNLGECSNISDFFGAWSNWTACEYSLQKYCYCRYRSCLSCNTSLCNNGPFIEVQNCSVNPVKDKNEWLIHGSIDGGWSKWSTWSNCNVSSKCGNNSISRVRTCTSPTPANGGRNCYGDSFECNSCPGEPLETWGEWGSWGKCMRAKDAYLWNRTRSCKSNKCLGVAIKMLPCAPDNIEWGAWSICSCAQRVRHRVPLLISGCHINCTQLTYTQYEVCESASDCFSTTSAATALPTTTTSTLTTKAAETTPVGQVSTSGKVTTVGTTQSKICTPAPTAKVVQTITVDDSTIGKSEKPSTIKKSTKKPIVIEPVDSVPQTRPRCDPQNKFSLTQLIIILTVVIVTCFFVCGIIIYLILRRTKHNEKIIPNGRMNSTSDRIPLKRGDFNPTS